MELRRICADPKCRNKFSPVADWQEFCSERCATRVRARRFRARQRNGGDDGGGGKRRKLHTMPLFPVPVAKTKPAKPEAVQDALFPVADNELYATFGGSVEYNQDGSVSEKKRILGIM